MVRTKVFVGNLSFKTKEPELKAHFSTAGNVIDVNIITRGPRSLGYGFVEMESEEAANAAIQSLHHKDVDGRQINVELVKEPKEGEEAVPRERKPRPARQPREGGDKDEAEKPRKPREPTERKPRGERKEGENATGNGQPREPRAPREAKPRAERADNKAPRTEKPKTEGGEKKPREPREARPRKSNAERSESDTLLFVANLPFSLDNDAFLKFVTDLNLTVKQAYVVKKHNNRSKGYGFIEFNNQADQKAGLEKLNGLNIQDRPISVKIALTQAVEPETETGAKQENKAATPQATPAAQSPKPADPKSPAAASPKKTPEKQ